MGHGSTSLDSRFSHRQRQEKNPRRTRRRSEPLITAHFEFNVLRSRFGGLKTFAKKMIRKILAVVMGFTLLTACSSSLPDASAIQEGSHKSRAISLLQRNPGDDATAFYHVGGVGYIMTYGGVRMPIGVRGAGGLDSRDFESLKPLAPILYSQIHPLLVDSDGPLTMAHFVGGVQLSKDRRFYQDVRGTYATKFNRRMESLAKHQSELAVVPNRSLAPTLKSTSSVRGSEDF